MAERVLAVIPAKSRSRRVPNKNMRPFNGRPLLEYTIEAALKSRRIDDVCVSTDSVEIKEFSTRCGAKVPFLRPPELCGDDVHGSAPILYTLERLGGTDAYGFCVQLLPTSPLKTATTIDAIIALSQERSANVLSVTPTGKVLFHMRTMGQDGRLETVTPHVGYNFQTQDLPELFSLNGAIYCAPVAALLQHRTFQYGGPIGYPMHPLEALDIDTEIDFLTAERLASLCEAAGVGRL